MRLAETELLQSGDNFIPGTDCHLIITIKMFISAEGATIYGHWTPLSTYIRLPNSTMLLLSFRSPTNMICFHSYKILHMRKRSVWDRKGVGVCLVLPPYLRTGHALESRNVFVWAVFTWHPRSPAKKSTISSTVGTTSITLLLRSVWTMYHPLE